MNCYQVNTQLMIKLETALWLPNKGGECYVRWRLRQRYNRALFVLCWAAWTFLVHSHPPPILSQSPLCPHAGLPNGRENVFLLWSCCVHVQYLAKGISKKENEDKFAHFRSMLSITFETMNLKTFTQHVEMCGAFIRPENRHLFTSFPI